MSKKAPCVFIPMATNQGSAMASMTSQPQPACSRRSQPRSRSVAATTATVVPLTISTIGPLSSSPIPSAAQKAAALPRPAPRTRPR